MKRIILNVLAGAVMAVALTACGSGGGSVGKGSYKIKMTTEAGGGISFDLAGSGTATVDWGDGSGKVTLTLSEGTIGNDAYMKGGVTFEHTYPSATIRNITVNGDNITVLYCSGFHGNNELTNIDVSKNKALIQLDCSYNKLTNLDVSKNSELTYLDCCENKLTNLDVSKNSELTYLNCNSNQLTSLDVSKNSELTRLYCRYNQLTSLDVSNNIALIRLYCDRNQLSVIALNSLFGSLPTKRGGDYYYDIDIGNNPGTNGCDRSIAESKGWYAN